MLKYILKRILLLIPVLIGATFIVFFVMDMTPGDPAVAKLGVDATAEQIEELREEMGLNDPFPVRYGRFVLDLVQGDLGTSYKTGLAFLCSTAVCCYRRYTGRHYICQASVYGVR